MGFLAAYGTLKFFGTKDKHDKEKSVPPFGPIYKRVVNYIEGPFLEVVRSCVIMVIGWSHCLYQSVYRQSLHAMSEGVIIASLWGSKIANWYSGRGSEG